MLHTVERLLQGVPLEIEHQPLHTDLTQLRDVFSNLFDRTGQQMTAAIVQSEGFVFIEPQRAIDQRNTRGIPVFFICNLTQSLDPFFKPFD